MYKSASPSFRGASRAILTAGPLFVALTMTAMLYMQLPRAIEVEPAALVGVPLLMLFALIFGPFVACIPIAIGTCAMNGLSNQLPFVSSRPAWGIAGLAIGISVAHVTELVQETGELAFALIITCGVSAWLCHSRDPDQP